MTGFKETTIAEFTFCVDPLCLYSAEGIWVRVEGTRARLGVSDYVQHSWDIAFAEIKPAGTILAVGDEFASIETVKTNVMLASPVAGKVASVNPALENTPEMIKRDPFGVGWICEVDLSDWDADRQRLLDADAYFTKIKHEAETA